MVRYTQDEYMSKYVLLQESQIDDLRLAIDGLVTICETILKTLDSVAGTVELGNKPHASHKEEKRTIKTKRKKTGSLLEALLAHVPNEPFTPRQALESIGGHYKFHGKKNRGIDSVRNVLRAGVHFTKLDGNKYQRKEFKLETA